MRIIILISVGLFAFCSLSCAPKTQFVEKTNEKPAPIPQEPPPPPPPPPPVKIQAKEVPACELELPFIPLAAHVQDFQITSIGGASLSVNLAGFFNLFKISKRKVQGDLNLSLTSLEDENPWSVLGSGKFESKGTEIGVLFENLGLGGSSFVQTPFGQVLRQAVREGLSQVRKKFQQMNPLWYSILQNKRELEDESFLVRGGEDLGLQVGDEFEIYTVSHHWKDRPCASDYQGYTLDTEKPLGTVKLTDAKYRRATHSELFWSKGDRTQKIPQGAFLVATPKAAEHLRPPLRFAKIHETKFQGYLDKDQKQKIDYDYTEELKSMLLQEWQSAALEVHP